MAVHTTSLEHYAEGRCQYNKTQSRLDNVIICRENHIQSRKATRTDK